jgi:hypothetical protein
VGKNDRLQAFKGCLKYKEKQTGEQCFVLKTLLTLVASADSSIGRKPIYDTLYA